MPKIVGFIGASEASPHEPRFEWMPTIIAGMTSYALLLVCSLLPGRALVANAKARMSEFKPQTLNRFAVATRDARAGELRNPVPADAAKALAGLPPNRYSYDADRGLIRIYKASTTLRGAVFSTRKAAYESGHPHLLIDTMGSTTIEGTVQRAAPVLLRSYRADGLLAFAIEAEDDAIQQAPVFLPTAEQRAERKAKGDAAKAARALRSASQATVREQKQATREAARIEKKAKLEAELDEAAMKKTARAEAAVKDFALARAAREEAVAERRERSVETGVTRKAKTSREVPVPVPVLVPVPRPVVAKPSLAERADAAALGKLRVAETVSPAEAKAAFKARKQAGPRPESADAPLATVLIDYTSGVKGDGARVIDALGDGAILDTAVLRAAGLKPGDFFNRGPADEIVFVPDAKLTVMQLDKIEGHRKRADRVRGPALDAVMSRAGFDWLGGESRYAKRVVPNARRWGTHAAGILIVARDTRRVLLMLRSADVLEPHTWALPGGKCETSDASMQACAVREFREESGYEGRLSVVKRPVHIYREPGFEFHNFIGVVNAEFEPDLDWENDDAGWFALNELPRPLHPGVRELFRVAGSELRAMILGS